MTVRRPIVVTALVVAGTLALTGCSGDEPASGPTSSPTPTAEQTATDPATATAEPTDPATPTDSAVGELVEGFPVDVVAVPVGAEVTISSVVPVEGRRQVSLAGQTAQSAEEVLVFYRDSLVAQGFVETAAAVPEGVTGATFSRTDGTEILNLTVVTSGGTQQFTIGGFIAGG